jgi:uncharacterized LabA/DUF88 family protein
MANSPDVTSMALFCDFENVALGVRETHHEKFDIKLVLERLLLKGSIVVKKAYCDWERYKGFKAPMHEASFELIEIPHVRQSGKNSADIRLVVDALDLCYTKSHVNTFVIISGDSDFSPLVSKLRENNKQVIGVGVKESTSDLLVTNCDEFIFYDDLVRESGRQSMRREQRPPQEKSRRPAPSSGNADDDRRREDAENRRNKAVELALQTFEALYSERGDGGKIWASVLKEAIKRRKPDFSESYYGFRSFGGLLEEMQARGFLKMGRDEKSNAYVFRSGASEAAGAAGDAAPAAPEVLPVTHRAGEADAREPRGRGRGRGSRRDAPARHDFEPTVAVESPQAALPLADDEDDAAERFADAARASQAGRDVNPPGEPAPGADTYVSEAGDEAAEAVVAREATSRRGNRGGRGRGGAARKPAEQPVAQAPAIEAAPPAPAAPPEAELPAGKVPRARKTAASKTASGTPRKPAAPRKTAARKTKTTDEA